MPPFAAFRRTLGLFALAGATTLLASCQTVNMMTDALRLGFSNYQEPPQGQPHALLRVSADGNVAAFPGSACQSASVPNSGLVLTMERLQVGAGGLNGQKRGVPGAPAAGKPYAEFRVPAGVPLTLGYGYSWREGSYDHGCSKVVHFTPQPGVAYEFTGLTSPADRVCGVRVVDLTQPAVPVALQDAPRCKG